jgi:large subunit ribosomal protein L13
MSTSFPSEGKIARKWHVVDASGQTLGRLATQVAHILAGKHNPQYTPFLDTGDHVVVINAAKVKVTGMKSGQKMYRRYTGFPGGLREEQYEKRIARRPEAVVEDAIKGMLPKSKLGRAMGSKLKVYRDDKHTHAAQKPEPLQLAGSK